MSLLSRIVREPLVHFLLVGVALFAAFSLRSGAGGSAAPEARTVVVDREALLEFIQYRSKAFEAGFARTKLSSLAPEELERLIEDYVREEVLHREALRLGLDADDYVIRRRLVQKLEFITRGFAEADTALDDAAVKAYFEANAQDYFVEPHVTFTHVFFDAERRGRPQARALAEATLVELNAEGVPFADAPGHGDRFPYHVNYVERTLDYVASHFGPELTRDVYALEPNAEVWHGPFESPYGAHLVMVTRREAGRLPAIEEIRGRVVEDARRDAIRRRVESSVGAIVDGYDVRVVYRPEAREAEHASVTR
ncbi:MAG: peptidyl-prolyl cis-trans isomerase [Deltaproteobacteria bacterium]|nr:MAG: peptidyl-prolyl cis-trans isomerase [Deltaproteobacteria bacterium]